jgi:nucleoside-diphosphate-sugar epimerase
MKILLTGATGYIGKFLPLLIEQGHHVVCCTRDKTGFILLKSSKKNTVIEVDF